jgi:serine/threonine-protein kinase
MGAVYEVEHARTGEHLALKVLHAGAGSANEAIERFKREARASGRIKSEHVVRVTDADVAPELEGAPFLVMELLDGMDLEQAAAAAPPSAETVLAWLRQVAEAIDKAHGLGIIHRDLKPENLFLATVEGRRSIVKVLDFGIAKMIEDGTGVTGSGQMLGTPRYMSPEQASPNAPVTPASDRCALGLIAYRLLVGESYYQGGPLVILGKILHGDLPPPSACASRFGLPFDAWFLKACHRDPRQRFTSASEQIEALADALGLLRIGGDVTLPSAAIKPPALETAPSGDRAPEIKRAWSRRPVAVAVLLAAGLTVVFLAGRLVSGRRSPGEAVPVSTVFAPPPPAALPASSRPARAPAPALPPSSFQPPTGETLVTETRSAPKTPARGTERPRGPRRHAWDVTHVAGAVPPGEKAKAETDDPYVEQK